MDIIMDYIEVTAKTLDDAITQACQELLVTSDNLEYIVVNEGSSGFLGINSKPFVIKARKNSSIEEKARVFLDEVFQAMNMEVGLEISYNEEENVLDVNLSGEEMGVLIGKRGQTLDAFQYLTSLIVNKENESYTRVKVDTENYRKRRKDTLESLSKNISYKVKRTKKSVSLEPMNPYERRIIHSALQGDKYVTTHSEGNEPFRRVVISIKK